MRHPASASVGLLVSALSPALSVPSGLPIELYHHAMKSGVHGDQTEDDAHDQKPRRRLEPPVEKIPDRPVHDERECDLPTKQQIRTYTAQRRCTSTASVRIGAASTAG